MIRRCFAKDKPPVAGVHVRPLRLSSNRPFEGERSGGRGLVTSGAGSVFRTTSGGAQRHPVSVRCCARTAVVDARRLRSGTPQGTH